MSARGTPDEYVYRVTYDNGEVSTTCNRRSLGGKIGLSNQYLRQWLAHEKRGWRYNSRIITRIERAPLDAWTDVTDEFESLVRE